VDLPVNPPVSPMLARSVKGVPAPDRAEGGFLYEPKWDGFRCIVFRDGDEVELTSRNERPMTRYFPEVVDAVRRSLPRRCVLDGELVVTMGGRLEFERLQERIHPADSRVRRLAAETPASLVVFDALALGERSLLGSPLHERRAALEEALAGVEAPVHLTPATRDHATALGWFDEFEGAGLDGVIAKPADATYQPGKRAMFKIKHARTADCVVAGFRWHKTIPDAVGSLLLALYDHNGTLHHVGVTSSFTTERRKQLVDELAPLRKNAMASHPWREWARLGEDASAGQAGEAPQRMPGGQSRWSAGKDLSWEPLRIERVCEVKYDHMQGDRFRHAATFLRWRSDKAPQDCRYDQLEVTPAFELSTVFGASRDTSPPPPE
jgi:ATP-dependent DNA ligase